MSGYISDSSNIGCIGIIIYLDVECAAYYQCLVSCSNAMSDIELFEMVILLLDVSFSKILIL